MHKRPPVPLGLIRPPDGASPRAPAVDAEFAEYLLDTLTAAALPAALRHAFESRAQNVALMAANYALEAASAVIVRRAEHLAALLGELRQ